MKKILLGLIILFSISQRSRAVIREEMPAPLPITSAQINFYLIPHEPGPQWECHHREVPNLPYDWRVYCRSLTSTATAEFLVHFLIRTPGRGTRASILEVLYWVDEYLIVNNQKISLSHGQSSLIGLAGGMEIPVQLSLGQFVQNGTSSLSIIYSYQPIKRN